MVPFTSLITETAEVEKQKTDYSDYALLLRAKQASEDKALLQVAPALQKFISKTM